MSSPSEKPEPLRARWGINDLISRGGGIVFNAKSPRRQGEDMALRAQPFVFLGVLATWRFKEWIGWRGIRRMAQVGIDSVVP
jgi:hypothetical protein